MRVKSESEKKALLQDELRDRVVQWKSNFFGSSWAHYELAKPGSFHLVPHLDRQAVLRRDYQAMRDMYLLEPLSFEQILTALSELEDQIYNPEIN